MILLFFSSVFRFLRAVLPIAIIGMTGPSVLSSFAAEAAKVQTTAQELRVQVQVQGDRISIDAKNASLQDLLREIGRRVGIDVTAAEGVSGEVTLRLADVTIETALETLCRNRARPL